MTGKKLKILFISRVHPPIVGGMENQSYHLIRSVGRLSEARSIINRGGKKMLPFFIPTAMAKALAAASQFDVIHLSDGVLAPLGYLIKLFYPKVKVAATIHGLDITYARKNKLYKAINLKALSKLDKLIAVSRQTKELAEKFGLPGSIISVIPNGVLPEEIQAPECCREDLISVIKPKKSAAFAGNLAKHKGKEVFILTLGRLCRRKGVRWFIENVMPNLRENVFYLIAGSGAEKAGIEKSIKQLGLENRVCLLGSVSNKDRKILFNTCDVFVQPNIRLEGDAEGFGITLLEAASAELPIVASNLEGIQEAISNGKNGFLVPPHDALAFKSTIHKLIDDTELRKKCGSEARSYTEKNFSWDGIAKNYYRQFEAIASRK